MSLYSEWTERAQQPRTQVEQNAFWSAYFQREKENYAKILADPAHTYEGALSELANIFAMDDVEFTGFLDGINTSLKAELDLDSLAADSQVKLDIDMEKLYYNMLEAKASWLWGLPQWDGVLSEQRRREITKEYRAAKMFINPVTVGRNDPCPCGSGKKYKNCCGKAK